MFKNRIIVACSQNYNGYGMLRSLHELGVKPVMLINHSATPLISLSRYKGKVIKYDCVSEIPDILKSNFWDEELPPVVICCDDDIQAIVDMHYEEFKNKFLLSNVGKTAGLIERMMSKHEQMKLALKCGINVPKTWSLKKGEVIPQNIVFPCFIKSDSSLTGGKSEMHICQNISELQYYINQRDYIVQEYINKDFEITIWGTSIGNNDYYMTGVGKKIRQFPNEKGLSSFCVLKRFEDFPGLDENRLKELLKEMRYTGMFNIEMAVKDNTYYLLEVNLRNGGKQHFSTVAGANLPKMYIQSMLSLPVEIPKVKTPTYYMGELTDYQHIGKTITFKEWYKCFKMTDCFFIANWKDPLPFVSELVTKVKDTIRYRLGLVK